MSLDKQRILNELGSVMNQLQTADCGCMGKLFSNSGQGGMGHPLPTCGGCRRGCCRGHGPPSAGEPYCNVGGMCGMGMSSGMPSSGGGMPGMGGGMSGMGGGLPGMEGEMPGTDSGMSGIGGGMPGMSPFSNNGLGGGMMNRSGGIGGRGIGMPCMGSCNPKKMYTDTYSYLNQNLMQPVVQDVYKELSSISPSNTVGNNPLANSMGLSQGNAAIQGNAMMQENAVGNVNATQNMSAMFPGNPNQSMGGVMGSGMGAHIMNMMTSGSGKPTGVSNDGQMIVDAPQSPHGQGGVATMNPVGQTNASMDQGYMNPPIQYVTQDNMYGTTPGQDNLMTNSMAQSGNTMSGGMAQSQPAAGGNIDQQQLTGNMAQGNVVQNMNAPNQGGVGFMNPTPNKGNNARYGHHATGMKKFNEMFPGLMNGDLGFDPMAIAIQMNPANQKQTAMNTMAKLLNGNLSSKMEPSVTEANAAAAQFAQINQQQATQQLQQGLVQNQVPANHMNNQQMISQQNLVPSGQVSNQQMTNAGAAQQNQQQVNQAVTGNQNYQQGQHQQMVDPNTGAVINAPGITYQGNTSDANAQQQSSPLNEAPDPSQQQQMMKEPIFPAFTRNQILGIAPPQSQKQLIYNTLGQPVELLPGNLYHTPEPPLPQTLSPNSQMKLKSPGGKLDVKSTVSKTSLMRIRPTAGVPSKSQLQQIYQQYKGSKSYTNQNVIRTPGQVGSSSAGKLNTANNDVNQPLQIPIEKIGGDSAANNNNQITHKVGQVMGQIGDVPAGPKGEVEKAPPMRSARLRNGLQDMNFTSPPSNPAWSFHGEYNRSMRYQSIYR